MIALDALACPTCGGSQGTYHYEKNVPVWDNCETCDGTGNVFMCPDDDCTTVYAEEEEAGRCCEKETP